MQKNGIIFFVIVLNMLKVRTTKVLSALPSGAPAMYCLLEILAVAKDKLAPQFVKHIDWIKVTQYLPALYIETNLEGPAS